MNDQTAHVESLEHLLSDACPHRARVLHWPGLPSYVLALCIGLCAMVGAAVVLA